MNGSKAETTKRLLRPARSIARVGLACIVGTAALLGGTRGTQNAVANGDTRTISIRHMHTKEEITITFKRDGRYVADALEKLNWALRDWRIDEPIRMDPRLFDIAWEVHRKVGSDQPFHVVSAYRSPGTNSMLRRRSRGVAKQSQHMVGRAMDFYLPDTATAKIREVGMRMQRGGVGFYPGAHTPFIHLDAGSVRSWPRMTRDQLVRLFPDEKTVHLPADGRPLGGYEMAKAEILSGGGSVMGYAATDLDEGAIMASGRGGKSFWAALFGGDDEEADARPVRGRAAGRNTPQPPVMAYAGDSNSSDGGRFAVYNPAPAAEPVARNVMRERSNRATAPVAQPPQETQIATAPAAPAAPPPEPAKPAPVEMPLPVARPGGLTPPPGSAQLAALASDATTGTAPAEQRLTLAALPPRRPGELPSSIEIAGAGRPIDAPLPPSRPGTLVAMLSPQESLRLTTQAETEAPPPGARLVPLTHPMPPARPRASGAQTDARASETAAVQARTPMTHGLDADRAGLDSLFAAAARAPQPSGGTRVATAKAKVTDAQAKGWVVGPSPAAALGFSTAAPTDTRTSGFSGPAVRALPTTFVQN